MKAVKKILAVVACASLAALLASCATVNRLDGRDFQGATLAADMQTPPDPRVDVRYDVTLNNRNPVYSALSVMTNLAKAGQAEKASEAMRGALASVDVPDILLQESYAACAAALDAEMEHQGARADYMLVLSIRDWGIWAHSYGSAVSLHLRLTAGLYRSAAGELIWRRDFTVNEPASPAMFGLGQIVGNMVTATVLSEMSEENLARGFTELARRSAQSVARQLEKDLSSARYGGEL
jgi:ABC-type uncharacterized transport system auxiliary subunit